MEIPETAVVQEEAALHTAAVTRGAILFLHAGALNQAAAEHIPAVRTTAGLHTEAEDRLHLIAVEVVADPPTQEAEAAIPAEVHLLPLLQDHQVDHHQDREDRYITSTHFPHVFSNRRRL